MSFVKKFKSIFHLTIWEFGIAIIVIIVYFILDRVVFHGHAPFWLIIFGFIVGTWLAFRPSEWAVEGLDSGSKYVGLSDYVAGTLSSLASNLPEAVIAILLITQGKKLIAAITVLSAAGFNTLILGIAILISTIKNRGQVDVPDDLKKKEAPIIRWAIVALSITVILGFIEYFQVDNIEEALFAKPVAGMLFASYLAYLAYILFTKNNNKKMSKTLNDNTKEEKEIEGDQEKVGLGKQTDQRLSIPITILLLIMGFVGIYFGGETLTESVIMLMDRNSFFMTMQGKISAALILGAAGAVPEHGIAIVSAAKDEIEVGIGNAMGGILQSSLLIFGLLGIIVASPIQLHPFILLQLASIGGTLWFVKRCLQDGKFDTFEGFMIILLQILVFVVLYVELSFI
ncbi:MAG: hypothetical protein KAS63_05775 [Candidatus Heimdallarchaeota archaeon]|nr:hypothetical protein [Candidatus Heimdallarchaeota archaeon]MCK4954848.1 hypothetical protein [Candidatus Heimdallarchaeota archaeon]